MLKSMDQSTIGNIQSTVQHAIKECEGILELVAATPVDVAKLTAAYEAAYAKLTYVETLLASDDTNH